MAVGYQSFYQAQLTSNITDTDLTIPLDVAPTPDEGFLVIESTVTNKREIIYYTSKTANSVICPANGRGYDGTTAVSHLQGAAVIMAPVGAMFEELRSQFTTTPQGWTTMAQAVSTVTHNGNRSYSVEFDASVASTLSEGMRLEFTKTVAGNGYMGGAFNGSSHYFTKTTPSGTLGTVTNNFTIEAVVQPTSYASGAIACRGDATTANSLALMTQATGQVRVIVTSGGATNYRLFDTSQSLPLNKKTHVAASWASGTVVVYFDGISVPLNTVATGGTAPTTAGTGGDFSIGRRGANGTDYFPGYISNVAVFDAVLSAATIRQHATYKLTGSETNCIGAWSLDNTANDQSSAGNNLTATGGVGYTAMTPHGQLGNGVETNKAVGLVMGVSSTTATVQVPEGVTIHAGTNTGNQYISTVSYSTQANPFGWVCDKGRWEVSTNLLSQMFATITVGGTWVAFTLSLSVPIGRWLIGYQGSIQSGTSGAASVRSSFVCLSATAPTNSVYSQRLTSRIALSSSNTYIITNANKVEPVSATTATTYTMYGTSDALTATESVGLRGDQGTLLITALPSGL